MKKFLFLVLAVLLLSQITTLAQQFKCELRPGAYPINRDNGLIWIDVDVSNTEAINDIKFDVTITYDHNVINALPITAYCVKDDGTNDPNKWTEVTPTGANTAIFHYWMDQNPDHNLGKSANTRKIMSFFVKFSDPIPQYGEAEISFTNFVVVGVNSSNTFNLTVPNSADIVINLGTEPPNNNDSLLVTSQAGTVDRQAGEARIKLFYKSSIFSFNHLAFSVYPQDLGVKRVELTNPTGRNAGWLKVGDHYEINIDNIDDQGFAPSPGTLLGEIVLGFDQTATGTRNIVLNNFSARDLAGAPLKVNGNLTQTIDLGQGQPPPPTGEFVYAVDFNLDRTKREAYLDFSYASDLGFDTVSFYLTLPSKVYPKVPDGVIFFGATGSYEFTDIGNNTYIVKIYLTNSLGPKASGTKFMRLTLGFVPEVTGLQELIFSNVEVKKANVSLRISGPLRLTVNFGQDNPPPAASVKYFLTLYNPWFYLDRPNGRGTISLLYWMDNINATTGGINFDIELPSYMELQQVIPLDIYGGTAIGKNISFQQISNNGVTKIFRVVYSAILSDPLSPNPQSHNPSAIIRLVIGFVDLPPWTLVIPINNIVASGLDGLVINQTKSMNISIDFLNTIYLPMFLKGDVNKQFGDGWLTQADVDRLIQIINNSSNLTLYERWAADLNGDGKIDVYDLTILQDLIGGPSSVVINDATSQITVSGRVISFNFTNASQADLTVYDYLGNQIKHLSYFSGQGQADLSELKSGVYFIKINKTFIKVLF